MDDEEINEMYEKFEKSLRHVFDTYDDCIADAWWVERQLEEPLKVAFADAIRPMLVYVEVLENRIIDLVVDKNNRGE
jgi:hypothetical protein